LTPGEAGDASRAGYFAGCGGGIVLAMTHHQASFARQTAQQRIRQAAQRRLARSLRPTESRARRTRRAHRFLFDRIYT
jgi:hypothetical protein